MAILSADTDLVFEDAKNRKKWINVYLTFNTCQT